jgi:hypothetical protein
MKGGRQNRELGDRLLQIAAAVAQKSAVSEKSKR